MFAREAGKQLGAQFGLDQMTPPQRKRWLTRAAMLMALPFFLVAVFVFRSTGLITFAVVIGLVLLTRKNSVIPWAVTERAGW